MTNYSLYCVRECPIGKPKADEFSKANESVGCAAIDMQCFVDKCISEGCAYEKQRLEFDKKEGD